MDKPHHHGNLRAALIDAGLTLLAEEGVQGLSLRKAAARAGVSHAAPAHHFAGKAGLVRALAAHGFRTFTDLMASERFRDGHTPMDQMQGICRGYLRFAEEHEALFQLIFTLDFTSHDVDEEFETASRQAYELLSEVCGLFEPLPGGPKAVETMIWSLVHGYASLRRYGRLVVPDGDPVEFQQLLPQLKPRS